MSEESATLRASYARFEITVEKRCDWVELMVTRRTRRKRNACAGGAAQVEALRAALNSQRFRAGLGLCRAYGTELFNHFQAEGRDNRSK